MVKIPFRLLRATGSHEDPSLAKFVFRDILRLVFSNLQSLKDKGFRLIRFQNASRHSTVTYHRRSFECLGITNHFVIPINLVGKKIE